MSHSLSDVHFEMSTDPSKFLRAEYAKFRKDRSLFVLMLDRFKKKIAIFVQSILIHLSASTARRPAIAFWGSMSAISESSLSSKVLNIAHTNSVSSYFLFMSATLLLMAGIRFASCSLLGSGSLTL